MKVCAYTKADIQYMLVYGCNLEPEHKPPVPALGSIVINAVQVKVRVRDTGCGYRGRASGQKESAAWYKRWGVRVETRKYGSGQKIIRR